MLLQVMISLQPENKRRNIVEVLSDLSLKYIGIAFKVWNAFPKCCAPETGELCSFTVHNKNRWTRRADIVDQYKATVPSTLMVVPYLGDAIVSTGKEFTSSFEASQNFSENVVGEEARKDFWNDAFSTGMDQESHIDAVSAQRNVQGRARQEISDSFSTPKRRACDTVLNGLIC